MVLPEPEFFGCLAETDRLYSLFGSRGIETEPVRVFRIE